MFKKLLSSIIALSDLRSTWTFENVGDDDDATSAMARWLRRQRDGEPASRWEPLTPARWPSR